MSTPAKLTARGTFDVRLNPQPPGAEGGGPFGRLLLDKQYQGDLTGASQGHMLGVQPAPGFAAYAAMEIVTGTLHGRSGSFMLQHAGAMDGGVMTMTGTVIPGSGTGELAGLSGRYVITVTGGQHLYELEYRVESRDE